ncbi:type 2 lanthipeptide synthetase LanM [Vagococcus fluvialis]|uniref:type 2 lanthipeptide synthetase LanM n=1 Tax=Vagococcus fluvialis TaxID=2738 RepID=UPI00203367F3|nr:type 2 lanthipeptide synthetase LanM [Vagococcus fluvialis]MCM2139856.1 type 2 lanthipeptide synthetase LanM [Vagococcus fluvialis]URZ88907.1 vagococcin T modification enzyme vcnM2 [Vagococcus fluvialis]
MNKTLDEKYVLALIDTQFDNQKYFIDLDGVFEEFCAVFFQEISNQLDIFENKFATIFDEYETFKIYTYNYLHKQILNLSMKTLINELDYYKSKSSSMEDVYDDFIEQLLTTEFHQYLYEEYPLLYKQIDRKITNYFRLITDATQRLINDFNEIQKKFRISKLLITDCSFSSGDFHNNGNTTLFFTINNKRIVYKPKNLINDSVMESIIELINRQPLQKYKLKHVNTINKGNYGWQIFIEKKDCHSIQEVERYYYRIGSFLSIFLALGTDDLHNENIISSNEYPYFIDLETLVKEEKDLDGFTGIVKNFFSEINSSVLSTMLLPTNAVYNSIGGDIGGISSFNEVASTKITSFQLVNKGTDKIRLENKEVHLGSEDNFLYLNGELCYPNNYHKKITEGFEDTFYILKNNIFSIYGIISEYNISTRCVFRPTYVYASFLDASNHPKYLKSNSEHIKLFQSFNVSEKENVRVVGNQEIESLVNGDIPYFERKGKNLICNQQLIISNYFDTDINELIYTRLSKINNINIDRQSYYIRLTLSTLTKKREENNLNIFQEYNSTYKNNLSNNLKRKIIIEKINSNISNNFIWDVTEESCTWITATQFDSNYSLNCVNGFLYEGGGILMYYLILFKKTNNHKYLLYAEAMFTGLEKMGLLKQNLSESAFVGAGSHIYLSLNLYCVTGKSKYLVFIKKTLVYLLSIEFKNIDYLTGVSGLLVLLKSISNKLSLDELIPLTKKAINFLDKNIVSFQPETGIAHGYSGLQLGYLAAADILKDNSYIDKANSLSLIEDNYFQLNENSWLDLRDNKSVHFGWCRGSSGISYVRTSLSMSSKQKNNENILIAIDTFKNKIKSNEFIDDSLCHGVFGAIDNLIDLRKRTHLFDKKIISELFYLRLDDIFSHGFRYGVNNLIESNDFFLGLTGLGYVSLRIEDENLPSILHLETF